ncbi:DAK2 domain-containing protein [Nocardia sp. NPDC049707]|uniref:DAK2 domain-containing protein n=1 Tax=Nocardia sp. NPDC049707 TaxID=3154735 RepID=UPI00341858B0
MDDFPARWVRAFVTEVSLSEAHLGDLDRQAGDGDFGTNISTATRHAAVEMDAAVEYSASSPFAALSRGFLGTGGTSGPLFALWFNAIAQAISGEFTVVNLAAGVRDGLQGVKRLGGAEVGNKTMVDAMEPAALSLAESSAARASVTEALVVAARAAQAGADSTKGMKASRGRASYLGNRACSVPDPGAVAVALFFAVGAREASA